MRRGMCIAVVAVLLLAAAGMAAEKASVLLEKGIYTEETRGDPSAAIPIYEKVLAETQVDRQVMAQAHLHLALCYRKLKQDTKARELLKQFVQQYSDQEALVAKAKPILEELTQFDPATLMPPDALLYVEMGSPGEQLEKVLKMLEGTPFANPLAAMQGSTQPAEPVATGPTDIATPPRPMPRASGGQFVQAFLNPSMIKEFKKVRSAAVSVNGLGKSGWTPVVAVLQPGESDALRGLLTALLVAQGQPAAPIEGMQVVQFNDEAGCAFDDEVFIVAAPLSQLTWAVRQYKGAGQPSLATATSSFAAMAPASSRRHDALTVWADPARCLEAARPMIDRGGMRDLMIISALADIPNMEGVVGRLRLVENGLTLEATLAYKPTHQSILYDLIRTPPMSGEAFAAVPPTAAALAGVALQPPGAAADPSAAPDARTELVRHITGLDLGRELFDNVQELVVFLNLPGEGLSAGSSGDPTWVMLARSLGVVIVSRDPVQTRALLDRLLALPATFSGQATTQPQQNKTEYPLVSLGRGKVLTAYLAQQGHTTVLALDPKVHIAAMEALRTSRNVRTGGPFAKALGDGQDRSKVVMVSVSGVLKWIDAMNSPQLRQPTSAPTSQPAASPLAQLAAVLADTTARLETVEQDNAFTVRLTVADIPPLKDIFPLIMQLQQKRGWALTRMGGAQPAPQERNKLLRQAGTEFLAAVQRNDPSAMQEWRVPGSPVEGKLKDLAATPGLATFQVQEVGRKGDDGRILAHAPYRGDTSAPAWLIYCRKQDPGPPRWQVVDVDSTVTIASGRRVLNELDPRISIEPPAPAAEAVPSRPKALQPAAERFVGALGRRDQAVLKELILPGSAAEKMVPQIVTKADFSTFRVQEVRRNGPIGVAVAMDYPPAGRVPAGMLVFHLRMIEEGVWRVFDVAFVPVAPASQPSTQPVVSAWKATLPSGVTVELIGVSESPSAGKPWWRPDGSPLASGPYSRIGEQTSPGPNERSREFAIRLGNLPAEEVGVTWRCDQATSSSGGGPAILHGRAVPELRGIAVSVPKDRPTATIQIGVAAGEWSTRFTSGGKGGSASGGDAGGATFSPAMKQDGRVVITVSHDLPPDQQARVVAIDRAGKLHTGDFTGASAGKVRQITGEFDLPLAEVKGFQLQARPYEWAEFRDVSLEPSGAAAFTPPVTRPAGRPAVAAAEVRSPRPGTFELHIQGADLRGVLQLLSTQGHRSLVASRGVNGTVTADLYGVTFSQALEGVLRSGGFVYREKDGIIFVYTPAELQEVLKTEGMTPPVVTEPLVQPSTQPATGKAPSPRPGPESEG